MSAYRIPGTSGASPGDESAAPKELVYRPLLRATERSTVAGLVELLAVPVLAGSVGAALVTPIVGLSIGLAAGGIFAWLRRRDSGGVLLRVEGEVLEIRDARRRTMRTRLRLVDLDDVVLDTKLEHVVHDGPGPVPAVAFAESRVGATIDRARIVLVRAPPTRTIPLTAERGSSSEATEELGRIRVFLRKHGWVPADERAAEPEEQDDESDVS